MQTEFTKEFMQENCGCYSQEEHAILFKISEDLLGDIDNTKCCIQRQVSTENQALLRKSKRWLNLSVLMAIDSDDFAKGIVSVKVSGTVYKINRIIKKHLLKRYE